MLCRCTTQDIVTSIQHEKLDQEIPRVLSMVRGFLVLHRDDHCLHHPRCCFSLVAVLSESWARLFRR